MWLREVGLLLLLSFMILLVRPLLLKKADGQRKWLDALGLVTFLLVTVMINVPLFGWNLYTLIWVLVINMIAYFVLMLINRYKHKKLSRFNTK